MLVIDRVTVRRALESYDEVYARKWLIEDKFKFYSKAQAALEHKSDEQLEELVGELRKYWRAFRAGTSSLSDSEIVALLASQDQRLRAASLLSVVPSQIMDLFHLVRVCAKIKSNKYSPSVVAMSKVLHVWNPKLFIVVDQEAMWERAFGRVWIWNSFTEHRRQFFATYAPECKAGNDDACDIQSYVAILSWSEAILKRNLHIKDEFISFVSSHAKDASEIAGTMANLDAVAVEWVLLGLAELPPAGVEMR